MSRYRVAINMEWTSCCNARCSMCPREAVPVARNMSEQTFGEALMRVRPADVFRVVVAGYGEPTLHPRFETMVEAAGEHPVRFDMVSNGERLGEARLRHLDGKIENLIVSFSSIDEFVYSQVHVGLDHERVKGNLRHASAILKRTGIAISLSPMEACLDTLPQTICWLRSIGIESLSMSPNLYDRAGNMRSSGPSNQRLAQVIEEYRLRSQVLDFVPSTDEVLEQWDANDLTCPPRNSALMIGADGAYLYCFNDPGHGHPIGHVAEDAVRTALERREKMGAIESLCDGCSMRDRYGREELADVLAQAEIGLL